MEQPPPCMPERAITIPSVHMAAAILSGELGALERNRPRLQGWHGLHIGKSRDKELDDEMAAEYPSADCSSLSPGHLVGAVYLSEIGPSAGVVHPGVRGFEKWVLYFIRWSKRIPEPIEVKARGQAFPLAEDCIQEMQISLSSDEYPVVIVKSSIVGTSSIHSRHIVDER